jgi:hypothetical protein
MQRFHVGHPPWYRLCQHELNLRFRTAFIPQEASRRPARTSPSTVEPDDPDAPAWQAKDSESLKCHPATPPCLARDMVPRHMASTVPADHLTGEEPRTVSRCQTPPHASTTAPSRECSRITHRQTAQQLHRIEQGADGRASPLHGPIDARNSLTQHQRITMLSLLITPYVVKLTDIRVLSFVYSDVSFCSCQCTPPHHTE